MKPSEITRPLLLLIFPIFLTACHDSPTKPRDRPSLDLAEVINVVWNLQGQSIAGAAVDLTFYDPFHLVYGAGEYFGDDGCNSFFGTYEIRSDSILPKSEGMTTMSCVDNSFSLLPLISPYKVQLTGDELKIFRHDTSYIYASAFTKSLAGSPLPGKVWILTACNDPEFEPLRSQGALPKVSFYEDRRSN